MTLNDFVFLPLIAFFGNFLVGYFFLQVFAFIRKTLW